MGYTYNHNIVCSLVLALIVILAANILQLLNKLLWRPYVLTRHFRNQGIHGPPYRLLHGSLREIKELGRDARDMVLDSRSNDIVPKVMPHYHKWFSKYGDTILYWYGLQPRVTVMDPELAKQILSNKLGLFVKTTSASRPSLLLGKGLVMLDGPVWASRRRILNPAFSMEKLKVEPLSTYLCLTIFAGNDKQNDIMHSTNDLRVAINIIFLRDRAELGIQEANRRHNRAHMLRNQLPRRNPSLQINETSADTICSITHQCVHPWNTVSPNSVQSGDMEARQGTQQLTHEHCSEQAPKIEFW
ncbi:Cytochrome P450 709B1 [Linum perenne]